MSTYRELSALSDRQLESIGVPRGTLRETAQSAVYPD